MTNEDGSSSSGGSAASGGDGSGGRGSGGFSSGGFGSGVNDPNDIITPLPLTTPCDGFGGVEPPCDEALDLVFRCNFGGGVFVSLAPRVNVDPSSVLKIVLLPLDGDLGGGGGQGGSADAPSDGGFLVGTVSISEPGATVDFWIDPRVANAFLQPLGGGYDPRWGIVALREGEQILEQRRFFLFAETNCTVP